jgi:hypothetical protein
MQSEQEAATTVAEGNSAFAQGIGMAAAMQGRPIAPHPVVTGPVATVISQGSNTTSGSAFSAPSSNCIKISPADHNGEGVSFNLTNICRVSVTVFHCFDGVQGGAAIKEPVTFFREPSPRVSMFQPIDLFIFERALYPKVKRG